MLLDVNLPDGSGFDLATEIRRDELAANAGQAPKILMLTARGGLNDRVRGLDHGVDDYLAPEPQRPDCGSFRAVSSPDWQAPGSGPPR